MGKKFSLPVQKIDITDASNNFLRLKIYAISDGVNNNTSEFLEESFEPSIPSFYNKPILAYYNKRINDTEEHNLKISLDNQGKPFEDFQYDGGERPVGTIPESAIIQIEEYKGRKWITMSNCIIWSNYAKQIADLIKKSKTKKVSVEVEFLDSYIVNDIEKVKLFMFDGITILGDKYNPGIPNAHLSLQEVDNSELYKKYRTALCFAMKEQTSDEIDILSQYGINKKEVKMSLKENDIETEIQKDEHFVETIEHKPIMEYDNINSGSEEPKKEEKMIKFIQSAKEAGFTFIGLYGTKLRFVKEFAVEDSKEEMAEQEKMTVYEADKDCMAEDKDFAVETMAEVEMAEKKEEEPAKEEPAKEEPAKEEPAKEKEVASDPKESEEYKALMSEKEKVEQKFVEIETELSSLKLAQFKSDIETFLSDKDDLSADEKSEYIKSVEEGKYADITSAVKDYAYHKFMKESEKESEKFKTNINKNSSPLTENKTEYKDRLDIILNPKK